MHFVHVRKGCFRPFGQLHAPVTLPLQSHVKWSFILKCLTVCAGNAVLTSHGGTRQYGHLF